LCAWLERQRSQVGAEIVAELRVSQPVVDGRLEIAELAAAIEAQALELVPENGFLGQQPGDRVGQLDLAARAGPGFFQQVEYPRRQDIAADDRQVRRRVSRLRLLDDAAQAVQAGPEWLRVDDAVL